jgi:hypothetical protein
MNLQENINRIKSMMGLNETSNPYSITWLEPTREYFTQELDELLGNDMRFSKDEFFHPQNYDLMYSIFPHTFKMIAEHSKGSEVDDEQEIKDILLDNEISNLMDDWEDFRQVLLKDEESQMEGFNLFNMGRMEEWGDEKINNTYYMGRFSKVFPGALKNTTSSGLIKQMTGDDGEVKPHLKGYVDNLEKLRNNKRRELPPPFVMKLPTGGRENNEYTLIGGHKRSTVAHQLNLPISAWFIDLSE